MFDMTCVIFAGGKSSRMGEDKSLLPFGGFATLTHYQYARLAPLFKQVVISTKSAEKFTIDAPMILDHVDDDTYAPTAGFVAIFEQLQDERLFVLSVDTPFVTAVEIAALIEADRPIYDATIARTESGSHPMCGIYHRSMLPAFRTMLHHHDHRLGKALAQHQTHTLFFDDEAPFANLNHPHEYQDALARLRKELT
jgi:molybdopterin-guanine dinucleotide biosynthesis protein A